MDGLWINHQFYRVVPMEQDALLKFVEHHFDELEQMTQKVDFIYRQMSPFDPSFTFVADARIALDEVIRVWESLLDEDASA